MRPAPKPATLVLGLAAPLPERGRPVPRTVETFLFVDVRDEGADVRSSRLAREVANAVVERTGGDYGAGILAGWPPEAEYRHLWRITILLSPTGPASASFDLDYWCAPGCPAAQVAMMWRFLAALRALSPRRPRRRGARPKGGG